MVGKLAVPLVVDMLRARRLGQLDDGTAQGLLELMRELLSHASAGPHVLHLFLQNPSNVDALLDMVESTDTFTTVATLQVNFIRPRHCLKCMNNSPPTLLGSFRIIV